jgi:hypothetical protein
LVFGFWLLLFSFVLVKYTSAFYVIKIVDSNWAPGLTPVILVTQEAEIRRISVPSQPRQTVLGK